MNKKFETRRRYDETANIYETRYKDIQYQKYREVFEKFPLEQYRYIVDLGSGTGLLKKFLGSQVEVICCDLSFKMLKCGKKDNKIRYAICADIENLPLKQRSTDVVTCFSAMQNLPKITRTLEEILTILNKQGFLIFTILQKLYDLKKLTELMKSIGFKIEQKHTLSVEDHLVIGQKL